MGEKQKKHSNIKMKWSLALGILIVTIGAISYAYYWAFVDIQRLPRGKVVAQQSSPDGTYTVKAHLSDAGTTTTYSIVGVLYFNKENRKSKSIYFQKDEDNASIVWIDNHTVIIDNKRLSVPKDIYDYRRK